MGTVRLLVAILALTAVGSAASANTPRGPLDRGFGKGGKVTTRVGEESNSWGAALQPDGKIVVAGETRSGDNWDFAVVRYRRNGALDTGFGSRGVTATDFGGTSDHGLAVQLQRDGKIVVAGGAYYPATPSRLARYRRDGQLDRFFGDGGKVSIAACPFAGALAIQRDGKIVVGGGLRGGFVLCRLKSDGSLDRTFGTSGTVTTGFDSGSFIAGLALQADGKIVAAGLKSVPEGGGWALARYLPDGQLDQSFANGGKLTLFEVALRNSGAAAVALQRDGKILVAGTGGDSPSTVVRLRTDGSLDATFGNAGQAVIPLGFPYYGDGGRLGPATAIRVLVRGKIVVAASTYDYATNKSNFAVVRFTRRGGVDPRFWGQGAIDIPISPHFDTPHALVVQRDGKVVLAGGSDEYYSNAGAFALVRLMPPFSCRVPDVRRRPLADARKAVAHADCATGRVRRAYSANVPAGRVSSQSPAGGALRQELTRVRLLVSRGPRP
jgi:uncharacterized delta-60 repeat protein